jgi:hypothetical protein
VATSPPTHADAQTARPPTTDFIPSPLDLTIEATTKHERRQSASPLSIVGSVWMAHDPTTRGPPITLFLEIQTAHFFPRIGRVILDAATRSRQGVTSEGGVKVLTRTRL